MNSSLILCALFLSTWVQGTAEDYERSAGLRSRWQGLTNSFRPAIGWLPNQGGVFWQSNGTDGSESGWVAVTFSGERTVVATRQELLEDDEGFAGLPPQSDWGPSSSGRGATTVTFRNDLDRPVRLFWVDFDGTPLPYGTIGPGQSKEQETSAGHVWIVGFEANDLVGIFVAEDMPGTAIIDSQSRARATEPSPSPEESSGIVIRDHNLVLVAPDGSERPLSTSGTAEDSFRAPVHWSPDGERFLAFQVTQPPVRRIPLLESSPEDRLQPEIHWLDYAKPGDPRPQARPRLFGLESGAIAVDDSPFEDSWSVGRVHWSPEGRDVHVLYNQRGHQRLTIHSIDGSTGEVHALLNEESSTFVDYSQKTFLHWLDEANQFLWASEQDGWNHLYRFDQRTGQLINQVTKGDWVVRRVGRVDEENQQVWFTVMGFHPDQDPYHEHLARVNFDGTGLKILTKGDGNHDWVFSPDRSFFIDRWSRVDKPAVTELRRSSDGTLVAELGRDSIEALEQDGFRPPQRFVAKGRDGETDIWGILFRPSNFDPSQEYPVIELIYAGPHGHHVPKSWGMHWTQREMAELGFVVVQIDGMGTNWRSRAFHDWCWQNLSDAGFPDRIAWLEAAAEAHPELDLSRVGIYGGSAGGQNALSAVLHHGDFYQAAAADCGCHDNRMDKIWWNEAWMGKVGPHYAANSNVTNAKLLQGKLLLTVGELDRNVDPASTLQVVDALIRADKDFDMILVPGAGHGVGEEPYLKRRRQDFFVEALYEVEPRR